MELRQLINEYCMEKEAYYRNQLVEAQNSYMFREADTVEHLEIIECKVRYEMVCEFCRDLCKLVQISK